MSDKSEEPTPKRLRKAREDGDSGASAFASQSVAFVVAVALVPAAIAALIGRASAALRGAIAHAADGSPAEAVARMDAAAVLDPVVSLVAPTLLAAGIAGAATQLVQTGGAFATKKLTPTLARLNPIAGLKQLFSGVRLFAVARALLGAALVAWLAYRALAAHLLDVARLAGRLAYAAPLALELARGVAWNAALLGLAFGALDLLVVRRSWLSRLRMSKDEVKREHKESEGDPQMKAARERAHHEVLAQATLANVKKATVVVVNPTHLACALRYDESGGDEAPVVVASGEGDLAARMVRAAHEHGVPVVRDVPLARALVELQVGDAIPEALYEAVAEILREAWDEPRE